MACLGGDFVGEKDAQKQKIWYFFEQIEELEEDEINAYLCNGGDSDPAETTVGKLSISCVDSTCDTCNMSGGAIRAPDFQSCNGTFCSKIMRARAAVRGMSPEQSHSRGRRDNPRTAHIREKRSDAPAPARERYLSLPGHFSRQ